MGQLRVFGAAVVLAALACGAAAQGTLPPLVKLVVGYPPGGSADSVARLLADKLRDDLGTTVIVENKPGAGGKIAADYVRQQPGDGSALLVANTHMMVMLPLTSKSTRYNPSTDFQPVSRLTVFYESVALPATSSSTTVTQWLDAARKTPSVGSFGVPAAGSVSHFLGYRLGIDYKVNLVPIPYKGAAPLVQDLLGGQVAAGIVPVLDVAPHVANGKVRVLAVNGPKRSPLLPNAPTLKELGIAGFDQLEWTALLAPPSTPKPVIERLNAALKKALTQADVKQRLEQLGMEAAPSSAEELGHAIASDLAQWGPTVKSSGFTVD